MGPDSTNFFCGLMQLSNCTRAEKASERLESMRGTSARLDRQVFAAGKKIKKKQLQWRSHLITQETWRWAPDIHCTDYFVQFLKAYLLLCSVLCNHNAAAVQGLGVTIDRCLMIFYGGLLRTLTSINEFQRKAFFVTIDYIIYIT
jgi:hypothetical protein